MLQGKGKQRDLKVRLERPLFRAPRSLGEQGVVMTSRCSVAIRMGSRYLEQRPFRVSGRLENDGQEG